jgi:hypothetical protein
MKRAVLAILGVALFASPSWAAGLKMTINDGRISIDAQDVTIRQILAEWARLGKTQIVNLERVTSGPITLKIEDVPEKEALEVILRTVPGHMAVPRVTYLPGASVYDRILILASATTVAVATRPQTPTFPSPMSPNMSQLRGAPVFTPGFLPDDPDDQRDDPAIAAAAAAGLVAAPGLMPMPPTMLNPGNMPGLMAPVSPPAQPAPTVTQPSNPWNAPAGTSRPSLAPPPPPAPTTLPSPLTRPRPPQADQ